MSEFVGRPVVYIAGPYSKPDPCENTHDAVAVANGLVDVCAPLIPHLSHFWHTMTPKPYEFWLDLDLQYLRKCDALLRFEGESSGADKEIVWALEWGIPVFYDEASLREWLALDTGDPVASEKDLPCFLACFGFYVWDDLARLRRATRDAYVREWHLASSRPYDREQDAA